MEIKQIRGTSWIRVFLQSFRIFHYRLALFISILSYVLLGNNINTKQVNICISLKTYYNKSTALELCSLGCGLGRTDTFGIWATVFLNYL